MEDLQLNHTQLIFIPGPTESDIPHIVQVTLNSETSKPLPTTPTTFRGEGFALVGSHRPWTYGKGWAFKWGDESITPAEDKWTFEFQVR
ncbi:unnamed protein product [Rhizoctonia solani]|uniref:Uncharacterized protein n=1 Tax=Rhizoctonia solani TaxID=456999 RepID=A0A8H3C9Z9_9AGAM|nr:unnamed protein product [Rhizoctonia solani]CAE6477420.1 unnamed protein product [Rhizoctonia solani]